MKKRTPRFLFNSGLAIKNVRDDIHRTAARYREWRVQNLSAIVISEESPPKNRIAGGLARHSSVPEQYPRSRSSRRRLQNDTLHASRSLKIYLFARLLLCSTFPNFIDEKLACTSVERHRH